MGYSGLVSECTACPGQHTVKSKQCSVWCKAEIQLRGLHNTTTSSVPQGGLYTPSTLLQYWLGAHDSSQLPSRLSWGSHARSQEQLRCLHASHGERCHTEWPLLFQYRKQKLYCFCSWLLWRIHGQRADQGDSQTHIQLWMWAHMTFTQWASCNTIFFFLHK